MDLEWHSSSKPYIISASIPKDLMYHVLFFVFFPASPFMLWNVKNILDPEGSWKGYSGSQTVFIRFSSIALSQVL